MENGPFIGDLPIQIMIFHSYVCLPEGNKHINKYIYILIHHQILITIQIYQPHLATIKILIAK